MSNPKNSEAVHILFLEDDSFDRELVARACSQTACCASLFLRPLKLSSMALWPISHST